MNSKNLKRIGLGLSLLVGIILSACNNKQDIVKTVEKTITQDISDEVIDSEDKVILFFGNSLTAGYRLAEEESFPSQIQAKIDSLDLAYTVINGGLSGETTAGGLNRIDWILKQDIDVFVLELGPNDMLRGLDLKATEENLKGIINKVKDKFPDIKLVIAGMLAPPNMGEQYAKQFASIYPRLAEDTGARLIPFLLDGVAGEKDLNLEDQMHPNALGYKIVADNVWKVLEGVL